MTAPISYFTPVVHIDGVALAFAGELAPGRESELFAALTTPATCEARRAQVVHEAYERSHTRLDEERWYALAKEYFDEYKALVERGNASTLQGHLAWLDEHFFKRNPSLGSLRETLCAFVEQMRDASAGAEPTNIREEVRVLH